MILKQLEDIWSDSCAWPEYLQAMRTFLTILSPKNQSAQQLLEKWAALPGLCCQSAGGQAEWADELAAAWIIFYIAANVMDSVEDGDQPDPEWAGFSPGMVVNVASGMYFSASVILNKMKKRLSINGFADEIIGEFYQRFLVMCGGQQQDLAIARPTLRDYWEIGTQKSGNFFAMACRSGAYLATQDPGRLVGFQNYGLQLGLMVQVMDDIEDVQKAPSLENWNKLYKSLPVIFALENGSSEVRSRLEALLENGKPDQKSGDELLNLIDNSGAVQFLLKDFENHRKEAVLALNQACLIPKYKDKLIAFLPALY